MKSPRPRRWSAHAEGFLALAQFVKADNREGKGDWLQGAREGLRVASRMKHGEVVRLLATWLDVQNPPKV